MGRKDRGKSKKVKRKESKLAARAKNNYNSNALASLYGTIKKDSKNWGRLTVKTREMRKEEAKLNTGIQTRSMQPSERQTRAMQRSERVGGSRHPKFLKNAAAEWRKNGQGMKKKKNNKRQQRERFQVKEPPMVPTGRIPWWKNPSDAPPPVVVKKSRILNTFSINGHSMWLLNKELVAFCKYVQLSPEEVKSREDVIGLISKTAGELFGINESDCQIFGSYSARQVCTFESDIDLAIWNLVATREEESESEHSLQEPVARGISRKEEALPTEQQQQQQQQEHKNIKKQHKVLKWKEAIDEFERQIKEKESKTTKETNNPPESVNQKNGNDQVDKAESGGSNNGKKENKKVDEFEPSLFVIDRVGAADEEKKEEEVKVVKKKKEENNAASLHFLDATDESHDGYCESDDDTADKLEGMKSKTAIAPYKSSREDDNDRQKLLALPDENEVQESDNDDNLESFYKDDSHGIYDDADEDGDDDEEEEELITTPRKRPRSHSLISLSSSTTCSDNQSVDETGLEVSFVTEPRQQNVAGRIDDEVRPQIVRKLNKLGKNIRRAGIVERLEVRKRARVPIINIETRYGYECDIGVGGHTGVDTSGYAACKISKYQSFAPVVIVLKILLSQQGLDKPFTGGLGSYKLYVLVASHIERHLAIGGSDSPAEMLFTFLFRYGDIDGFKKIPNAARTDLFRSDGITCEDGGFAEVRSCFRRRDCVEVFEALWWKLKHFLEQKPGCSLIRCLVNALELEDKRRESQIMASRPFVLPSSKGKRSSEPTRKPPPRHMKSAGMLKSKKKIMSWNHSEEHKMKMKAKKARYA